MTTTRDVKRAAGDEAWPSLPLKAWQETYATLQLWTQVVGKIRLAQAPPINHWWQVALYVTCRGLTTSPIPYGARTFQIDFDFIDHRLTIQTSDGAAASMALQPQSVADFYREIMDRMRSLGLAVRIWSMPVEIERPTRFEADHEHGAYDAEYAHRFWRILVQADRILTSFRAGFIGKVSPVHFFWGSFDLAVTRFSGRLAPVHPGAPNVADRVTREAYSHEVSSCGFWPGGGPIDGPIFYSYAYPQPPGFAEARVKSNSAGYRRELGEFILPYDDVRRADAPDAVLLDFLQSTYQAAAELGHWDRGSLERAAPR
ncbi:MAG TPA: DUF5996 family protein [Candidatus Binataceae bacterium]|nr:DUF5996 family protein [Candidatus Binataceae bacterium]